MHIDAFQIQPSSSFGEKRENQKTFSFACRRDAFQTGDQPLGEKQKAKSADGSHTADRNSLT
jgi:hypothetical protein